MTGRARRTTPAQALAGVVTAAAAAGRERLSWTAHAAAVPAILEELAAKPCATCGHRYDGHGYHGGFSAFARSACSYWHKGRPCSCREYVHGD